MSVQAGGNNWKGRVPSVLYRFKHVRSPDWPGNHRLQIAIFFFWTKKFSVAILDTKEGFEDNKNLFSS